MRLSRANKAARGRRPSSGAPVVPEGQSWWLRHLAEPTPGWVAPVWSAISVVPAVGRAQDYLTRTDTSALSAGVEVLGFHRWGWTFVATVAFVLVGLAVVELSRWPIVAAHATAAGVHVSYVTALAGEVGGSGRGWGVLLLPAGGLLVHTFAVALYLGPRRVRT